MTEQFIASNGVEIIAHSDFIQWEAGRGAKEITPALREYFQHERDKDLGVWRWPGNSEYVVRKVDTHVVDVTHEPLGKNWSVTRAKVTDSVEGAWSNPLAPHVQAAYDYFEAHPERKPWHDAQPGEVWVVEFIGERKACIVQGLPEGHHLFQGDGRSLIVKNKYITHAERIWPKENNDEF